MFEPKNAAPAASNLPPSGRSKGRFALGPAAHVKHKVQHAAIICPERRFAANVATHDRILFRGPFSGHR